MPVPTYDKFIEPILRELAKHQDGMRAREAHEAAADALGLSDSDRSERLPSGVQAVYKNRAGWAHDRLKRAGLSASPRRGYWKLTERGFQFANDNPSPLSAAATERLAVEYMHVRLRPPEADINVDNEKGDLAPPAFPSSSNSVDTPDDRLERALTEIRDSVGEELLDSIANSSPAFFEGLVLDVLDAMGYGIGRGEQLQTTGPGDAGIDGVISLDRLGLEKVYVQAKRWQTTVGRPEVQGFYGALAGQRATKGVFITTSQFTAQAIEFAKSVERIVLVDGQQLVGFMMEYGVGVSHRTVRIPKVDSDYFED